MTQNDSFIDEVTEEVRRDRLFQAFRRYGWIGILAVLVIVGGTAWRAWDESRREAEAERLGDALFAAISQADPATRATAVEAAGAGGPAGAVAASIAAAAQAEAGDRAAAAETLAALAADTTLPRTWRDLAALKRVLVLGSEMPPAERIAALDPIAQPGGPYRTLALEQQALARAETGETEAAVAGLTALVQDQEATVAQRRRAVQLLLALGVAPATITGTFAGSGADAGAGTTP